MASGGKSKIDVKMWKYFKQKYTEKQIMFQWAVASFGRKALEIFNDFLGELGKILPSFHD